MPPAPLMLAVTSAVGFQHVASGKALAPLIRVTRGMKNGVNRDRFCKMLIEYAVWKAAYQ
jgi:hypothetical protein